MYIYVTNFRVEALCNIYGSQLFEHWDYFESTSFLGKITMISEFLKIKVDFSSEPWQTLKKMQRFRIKLVHAKPQKISAVDEIPVDFPERFARIPTDKKEKKTTILSFSTIENAERFDEVPYLLAMSWGKQARDLGYNVDTIGAPEYKVINESF
ncbi:MAG: hypothetical protein AB4290_11605 [Spirulina sp.]